MAEALGARLLDRNGRMIRRGAAGLLDLASIDVSGLDVRLAATRVEAACNTENMLLGPRGVARIYGPQKGASPAVVRHLEQGAGAFRDHCLRRRAAGRRGPPGSGASGGLGAGLAAFAGAALCSRYDILSRFLHLDEALEMPTSSSPRKAASMPQRLGQGARRGRPPGPPSRHSGHRAGRQSRRHCGHHARPRDRRLFLYGPGALRPRTRHRPC
jgi:hypothetical protein